MIPTSPNALSGRAAPLTLGHEVVGVVEQRGAGVGLETGARVAVESNLYCGKCNWCRKGRQQLCENHASLGLMADGGLAEVMLAPASMCVRFGGHLPAEHAALAEPLSVVVRALRRGGIRRGSTVAVIGCGTVGLLMVQAARHVGAGCILAVERWAERRQLALQVGATTACSPDDALDASIELTGKVGMDVTVEAAGNPAAATLAVRLVGRGGRAVLMGVFAAPVNIDMRDFLFGEKEVVASLSHVLEPDFKQALALLDQRQVEAAPLISDLVPLEDVVVRGFQALIDRPQSHLKVIVTPNGGSELPL